MDENKRVKLGIFASLFGIISNLLVSALKLIVGFITSTISIVADGVNNLTDGLSSFISLFGFKMSSKKADKEHPYGHERMEYVSGFLVSVIVCVLGVELIINSITKIIKGSEATDKFLINLLVLVGAIVIKIIQAIVNRSIGKKIDSMTLKSTAVDSLMDVFVTTSVIIGLIVSKYTKYNVDGYLGVLVGLFVCVSGIKLIMDNVSPIIGEAPSKELIDSIKGILTSNPLVLGIHDLEIHSYGHSIKFMSCHVEVDSKGDIIELHEMLDSLEHECFESLGLRTTLHLDPVLVGDEKTNRIKNIVVGLLNDNLNFKFNIHDFRIVDGENRINVIFDIMVPYGIEMTNDQLKQRIFDLVNGLDNKLHTVVEIDNDYNQELDNIKE